MEYIVKNARVIFELESAVKLRIKENKTIKQFEELIK